MNYPVKILPNKKYKLIQCDLSNHHLVRSTTSNIRAEIFDNEMGQIREKYICSPKDQMKDLSTSLLGIFGLDFIKIEFTTLGKQIFGSYCNPDERVSVPIYGMHFNENTNKGFWVVSIRDIDGQIANYTMANAPFKARCTVKHTPAKWNFWHFSIQWDLEHEYWHQTQPKRPRKS